MLLLEMLAKKVCSLSFVSQYRCLCDKIVNLRLQFYKGFK